MVNLPDKTKDELESSPVLRKVSGVSNGLELLGQETVDYNRVQGAGDILEYAEVIPVEVVQDDGDWSSTPGPAGYAITCL